MSDESVERELGRMRAEIEGLQRSEAIARTERQQMAVDIKTVLATLNQAQGGWKVLMMASAVVAFLSSIITWAVGRFLGQ